MNYRARRTSENIAACLFIGMLLMFASTFLFSYISFTPVLRSLLSLLFAVLRLALPAYVFVSMQQSAGLRPLPITASGGGSRRGNIMITYIFFVLIFVFGLLYGAAFPGESASAYSGGGDDSALGIVTAAISAVTATLVPAFFEEYLYRHLICREMTVCGNGFAIILSSLIFALTHYSFRVFPYAFAAGLAIAFVYLYTGSVKYTIALHFLNNFASFVLSVVYSLASERAYTISAIALVVVLGISAMITLYFFIPRGKVISRGENSVPSAAFLTFPLVIFVICAVMVNLL